MHKKVDDDPAALDAAQRRGYEPRDANVRLVAIFIALIVGVGAVSMLILLPLYGRWSAENPDVAAAEKSPPTLARPPAPLLEPLPATDLPEVRAEENARLHSYGWINKDAGIVHIPVEEAIRRVGMRGLPPWPAASPQNGASTTPATSFTSHAAE